MSRMLQGLHYRGIFPVQIVSLNQFHSFVDLIQMDICSTVAVAGVVVLSFQAQIW